MVLETHWTGAVVAVCAWQRLKQRHRRCPHCNSAWNRNQLKSPSPNSVTNRVKRGNLSMTFLPLWSSPFVGKRKTPEVFWDWICQFSGVSALSVIYCIEEEIRGHTSSQLWDPLQCSSFTLYFLFVLIVFFSLYSSYSSERAIWDILLFSEVVTDVLLWYNGATSAVGNIGRFFLQDVNCSLPVYFCGLLVNRLWDQSW